jgi:DNA-binding response OmpR family regulator
VSQATVLLVDDDPVAAKLVRYTLEPLGYRVVIIPTGAEAEAALERERPSAVMLDLMLPDIYGLEVCQRLRARSLVPIVVVTAVGSHHERIECLRRGADEVLVKPYDPEELALRLEALRRRANGGAPATPEPYHYRGLVIDLAAHTATLHGRDLCLTPIEQRLLERLASRPGVVHLADELLTQVWGPHAEGQYATLYLHISRLRHKLGERRGQPVYLFTRSRVGYLLPPPEPCDQTAAGD